MANVKDTSSTKGYLKNFETTSDYLKTAVMNIYYTVKKTVNQKLTFTDNSMTHKNGIENECFKHNAQRSKLNNKMLYLASYDVLNIYLMFERQH